MKSEIIGAILYKWLFIIYLQLNCSIFFRLHRRNNLPATVSSILPAYQIVKCHRCKRNNLFIIHYSRNNYMEWHQLNYMEWHQLPLWIFPDCGGSSLRKAWILPRLPYRGDKDVCGWQAKRFQFPAKNPCRKFEQRAKSEIVSMRWNACNIGLRLTFLRFFQIDIGGWSWKVENRCYCNTLFGAFLLNIKDLVVFNI